MNFTYLPPISPQIQPLTNFDCNLLRSSSENASRAPVFTLAWGQDLKPSCRSISWQLEALKLAPLANVSSYQPSSLYRHWDKEKISETHRGGKSCRLPFEIQQKIISFLPLKEAVRTTALSARWKSLWSPVEASLNFDANPANLKGNPAKHEEKYQVMGTFMKSFVFPEQWKLYLNVVGSSEEPQIIVAKVTKGVGRELRLEFFKSMKLKKI
ncbi:hypothetical protein ACFX12_032590 [Malus domestica]